MTTGELIKAQRKKRGLTQKELGNRLGVSYQTFSQWENNLRHPKIENLRKIANALGCNLSDLDSAPSIGEDGSMKRYVIQMYTYKSRSDLTCRWITLKSMQYDTLEEAKEAFARLPIKADHRIAEAYTVVRYKPVKV